MQTKHKLIVARELIIFLITIAIGLVFFGIGETSSSALSKKIGILIMSFGYLFYVMVILAIQWFKYCSKYPIQK